MTHVRIRSYVRRSTLVDPLCARIELWLKPKAYVRTYVRKYVRARVNSGLSVLLGSSDDATVPALPPLWAGRKLFLREESLVPFLLRVYRSMPTRRYG